MQHNRPLLAKILKYLVYLAAFMPLIIFKDYLSPFHFGKAVVFRSLLEIMAVLYMVLILQDRSYLPAKSKLLWSLTLFTAVFGLTTFTSINFFQSFWGTMERMGGWFSFLHFWLFFVIAVSVLRNKEDWLMLIKISVFVSLLSAFYGFLQKTSTEWILGSGGRTKIFGTIGNPALFAGYMLFNAFLALMLASLSKITPVSRRFFFLIFTLNSLAILLSGVRGSVLALIVGIGLFGFLYAINLNSKKVKNITMAFLLLVALTGVSLFLLRNNNFVKENQYLARYSDISPQAYTIHTRLWAWQAGFDGFNDSFRYMLVGYGPENFNIPFSIHFNPKFFRGPGSETLFDRAHNQFIDVLITLGSIGFAAYILIYVFAFRIIGSFSVNTADKKETSVLKAGLLATLISYIIHNSFIFDTSANYLLLFIVLGFINYLDLSGLAQSLPEIEKISVRKNSVKSIAAGAFLAVVMVFVIYKTNILPARANHITTRAIVESWAGRYGPAVKKFKEAMSYDTFGKYEIRHRYSQYIIEYSTKNKIDNATKENLFLAIDNINKNISESPMDYLPYLYLSQAYILLGKSDPASPYNDLAIENTRKALEISPTFIRTYYGLGQAYLNKKDYLNAITAFKKAADLNPEAGQSWWYLGITQIDSGNKADGAVSVKRAIDVGYDFRASKEDLIRLVNIFLEQGDLSSVAEFYKRLIELEPNNPQFHASLAATYHKLGLIEQAVAEAKKAAELDPSFEPEARDFVRSLGRQW